MANPNFTCVLDAWREGTTLYGRMHYYRSGSYLYRDSTFPDPTMNLGGTVYTDTDFGNRVRSGIYVGDVYTTTFSRTVSGTGTRTVTFAAGAGQRSDFEGTWSVDVGGFPGTYTPPATPTISVVSSTARSITIIYGTTSFGNPSTGTVTLYGGTSPNPTSAVTSYNATGNITAILSNLKPGTTYYYRARATNGQLSSDYSITVSASTKFIGMYGSVNGQAKKIQKMYGSVNGQTKEIQKLYGSVNGLTKRIF